jgi:hypothetical protein
MRVIKFVSGLAAGLLMMAASASAATITFATNDGGDSVTPGVVTAVTPHPAWGDVNAAAGLAPGTADWISYANTGYGGTIAPNAPSRNIGDQTALFTRTMDISGLGNFNLWILADDTATVILNGPGGYSNALFTAVTTQFDPCAPGVSPTHPYNPIGCDQSQMGIVHLTGLTAGEYTLSVYAFQTNADVFGIQYAGNYTQADDPPPPTAPEPTSMVLLGTGLVGLATRLRRRGNTIS